MTSGAGGVFPIAGGQRWAVVADGTATGGRALVVSFCRPAFAPGPALHVHTREDEAIVVLDGELIVRLGDRTERAGAQTLVWLPRGVPHTFANASAAPVRGLALVCPAGLEAMFAAEAAYLATVSGTPDPSLLHAICAPFGVTVLGPPLAVVG